MTSSQRPIGFVLVQTARQIARAFESFLFEREGSLSTWLVLLALQAQDGCFQSNLAAFVGVQGPTLTHHLNGMEAEGLIKRVRSTNDRRVHVVSITSAGRRRFLKLRRRAKKFDTELRNALTAEEMILLCHCLDRLAEASSRIQPAVPLASVRHGKIHLKG